MASHQVNRFQEIAEMSAAATSCWVTTSGETIPWPTVVATAVPDTAPMILKNAAMLTACPGERTRVATDVAMALAVSWNPLTKSNVRPRAMITTRTMRSGSTILEKNAFDYIRDVLCAIGRIFEQTVQLAPVHA